MRGARAGLLLAAVSTILALAGAELAVRLLRPGLVAGPAAAGNPFWVHDPELGWFHRAGESGTFSRPEFRHGVTINRMGFRDRDREPSAPEPGRARRFRIAVLGDSFAWGHGVEDAQVFTRLLEGLLPETEVWNLAVSGYSTDQELLLYRRVAPAVRPDLLLVMVSRNDYAGNVSPVANGYFKPRFVRQNGGYALTGLPVPRPGLLRRAMTAVRRRSALANGLWLISAGPEGASGPDRGWEAQRALMGHLLGRLADEARAGGAAFALAIVPSVAHVYFPEVLSGEARQDAFLAAWAQEHGIPLLDLVPGFRERFQATGSRYHYQRDKHWNAAGHALAARLLAGLLEAAGLGSSRGPDRPPPREEQPAQDYST